MLQQIYVKKPGAGIVPSGEARPVYYGKVKVKLLNCYIITEANTPEEVLFIQSNIFNVMPNNILYVASASNNPFYGETSFETYLNDNINVSILTDTGGIPDGFEGAIISLDVEKIN